MIRKITFFLTVGFLCFGLSAASQAPTFSIVPESTNLEVGDTVVVNIRATNFTNMLGFQLLTSWDAGLVYDETQDTVNFFLPPSIGLGDNNATASNFMTFVWSSPIPRSLTGDTMIAEIVRFVATTAGTHDIFFDESNPSFQPLYFNLAGEDTPGLVNTTITVTDPGGPVDPPGVVCNFSGFGLIAESDSAATGEQLCLSINSCNWDDIQTAQWTSNFNPSILQFDSVTNINLPQTNAGLFNSNNTDGWVIFSWLDTTAMPGLTFEDTSLFDLCFTVIGAGGSLDTLSFDGEPLAADITNSSSNGNHIGFESEPGFVNITGVAESAATIIASSETGMPGTQVCNSITVQNFIDIKSFQYTLDFDTSILVFNSITNINPDVPNLEASINSTPGFTDMGQILTALGSGAAFSLTNGDTLYQVCFDIKTSALPGTSADVTLGGDDPITRLASKDDGSGGDVPIDLLSNDGNVNIIGDGDFTMAFDDVEVCTDSTVCVPFRAVDGFNGIQAFQWSHDWSPTVLTFTGLENVHPGIINGADDLLAFENPPGTMRLLYNGPPILLTLASGEILYELCYTLTSGTDGTSTDINTSGTPLPIDVVDGNGQVVDPTIFMSGTVDLLDSACPNGEIIVAADITDISCFGDTNGAIDLTVSGGDGIGTYLYAWDVLEISEDLTDLSAGNYTVTITSGVNTFTETYTVEGPIAALATSTTSNNVTCNGLTNGSVNLTVTGGTTDYQYLWNNMAMTKDINGVGAGTYLCTVTDANGCTTITAPVTVIQPDAIVITIDSETDVNCLDGSDGAIDISVMGGTVAGEYNYVWSNGGATTQDLSAIEAGTYTVTVTDDNSCTMVSTAIEITEPNSAVTVTNVAVTPTTCDNPTSGAIELTVSGGTPEYTYVWNLPGATTNPLTGLGTGVYTATVTDSQGCTFVEGPISVESNDGPTVTITTTTNPECTESPTGAIDITVAGTTGTTTYQWSHDAGFTGEDPMNLPPGNYTVTVTDQSGCPQVSDVITLTGTSMLSVTSNDLVNPSCDAAADGSVDITVTGTTPTYLWDNGSMTEDLTDVPSGTYNVTITEPSGCSITAGPFTLSEDGGSNVSATLNNSVNPTCDAAANGSIDINVIGATGTTIYLWDDEDDSTTEDLTDVPSGTYNVTITDGGGCTATAGPFELVVENDITATSVAQVNPTCDAAANGSIDIDVVGTVGTTTYLWDDEDDSTTEDLTDVPSGTYNVTITDSGGCTGTAGPFTLEEDNDMDVDLDDSTDASCNGATDGSIEVNTTGGDGSYNYLWNDDNNTNTRVLSNITEGAYTVTVTDGGGCTVEETFSIDGGAGISVGTPTDTDITCFGAADGTISIPTPTGGSGDYSFVWTGNVLNGQNPTEVAQGAYEVTVMDNITGCSEVISNINITSPQILQMTARTTTDISCAGETDGTIDISITGGTPNYSYSWTGPNGFINTNNQDLIDLESGTYLLTVTDANGCTFIPTPPSFVVGSQTVIDIPGMVVNEVNGSDGEITIAPAGGTGTYDSFSWTGPASFVSTNQNITGLVSGTYNVTVTDSNNCTNMATFVVNAANVPGPIEELITPVTCFGDSDGAIEISVQGGFMPYSFSWASGGVAVPGGTTLSGLAAGTYDVTVTGNDGALGFGSFVVPSPTEVGYIFNGTTEPACFGQTNGSIDITPTGGNGAPYSIDWGGADPMALGVGNYTPTISDAQGCTFIGEPITVAGPTLLVATEASSTNPSCSNTTDGSIEIDVAGGTMPYTYVWTLDGGSIPNTTQDISNLTAGTYCMTVTDARFCTTEVCPIVLAAPNPIMITVENTTSILCNGDTNGGIDISVTGGDGNYMFDWTESNSSTGINTEDLVGVGVGIYSVIVTDGNGCSETISQITLTEPVALSVDDIMITEVTGGNANGEIALTISGGTMPYDYNWTGPAGISFMNGPTNGMLVSGIYNVTITDSNGCTIETGSILLEGNLDIQGTVTDPTCHDSNDGSIVIDPINAVAPIDYMWSTMDGSGLIETAQNQFTLTSGTYNVTMEAANGVVQRSFTLSNPEEIIITGEITNESGGGCNGAIDITVSGGTLPYTYEWSNSAPGPDITDLCKGDYSVMVVDANGCIGVSAEWTVGPADLTIATTDVTNVSCNGGSDGSFDINVFGGCAPYNFTLDGVIINDLEGSASFDDLSAGNYIVTITDGHPTNPQTTTASFTVTEPAPIVITVENVTDNTDPSGVNCNGSINITVTGGSGAPYTYVWSNGATNQDPFALCESTSPGYNVVVSDSNGCTAQSEDIEVNLGLSISLMAENETCFGDGAGVDLTVTGGAGTPTYSWTNSLGTEISTLEDLNNVGPDTYTVVVTSNGSSVTGSATVVGPAAPIEVDATITEPTGTDSNGSIGLSVSGGFLNPNSAYNYKWTYPDGSMAFTQDIGNLVNGCYNIVITDDLGCEYMDEFCFDSSNPFRVDNIIVSNDACQPGPDLGILEAVVVNGTEPYTYAWSNGANTFIINGLAAGVYSVTVTDDNGATTEASQELFEVVPMSIRLEVDDVSGNIVSTVNGGVEPFSYLWNNSANDTTADIVDQPSGQYALLVTDANGCTAIREAEVSKGPCEDARQVITPNNDLRNDQFVIACSNRFDLKLEVFNRWGQLVFRSDNYESDWEGTDLSNNPLPEDGYLYVIEYTDGDGVQQIKGSLTIIR